jgi:hypothetical protein
MFNSRPPSITLPPANQGQTVPGHKATPTIILTTADAEFNLVNNHRRYADGRLKSRT